MKIHIVKKGETLTKIAKKYNVSLEKLNQINTHIKDGDKLTAGTKVKVPTAGVPLKSKDTAKAKEAIPVSDRVEVQPSIPQIQGQSQPQMIETPAPPFLQAAPEIPEMYNYEYPPQMTPPDMMGMPQSPMMPPMGQMPMMQPPMMSPMGQMPMMQPQMMPPMGQMPMMQPQMMPPMGQMPMMQPQMMPPMGQAPMMQPGFMPEMGGAPMMPPHMASPGMMGFPSPEMYPGMPQSQPCKPCQGASKHSKAPLPFPGVSPFGMNPTMLSPMQTGPFPGAEAPAPYNKNFFTQPHFPNLYHEQLYMTEAPEHQDCVQEYMPPGFPGAVSPFMMPGMPQMHPPMPHHPMHPMHMHHMHMCPPMGGHGPEMWECEESNDSSSC